MLSDSGLDPGPLNLTLLMHPRLPNFSFCSNLPLQNQFPISKLDLETL